MLYYLRYLITEFLKIWGVYISPKSAILKTSQTTFLPMTQTTLGLKSFFNGDPLTLEEHKMLPYRISTLGKENEDNFKH